RCRRFSIGRSTGSCSRTLTRRPIPVAVGLSRRHAGYRVELIYLKLPSVRIALARVRTRVAQGGHSVPAAIVRRRFKSGWRNFKSLYRALVDHWELYDNAGDTPVLLAEGG